jgi:hypothetical protein
MLVYPLYALAQVTVMPALGAWTYVELARQRRQLGRYQFGYNRRRPRGFARPLAGPAIALGARLGWFDRRR